MINGIDFVKRIDGLLDEKHETRKTFCEQLGISQPTMATWKCRNIMPSITTIKRIADFLGVSLDFLVTGEIFYNKNLNDTEDDKYKQGFKDGINFCISTLNKLKCN